MTKVYLDTSGWNWICDWISHHGTRAILGPEYLFSSCNLDEFVLSDFHRAKDLASCAWRISNRNKLLDHLEMTVMELNGHNSGKGGLLFDYSDPVFIMSWKEIKNIGPTKLLQDRLSNSMHEIKRSYRGHLRSDRKYFNPLFKLFSRFGLKKSYSNIIKEMETDGSINQYIYDILSSTDLLGLVSDADSIFRIPYKELPCTACWIQYLIALSYVSCFESGIISKPDYGDQIDFRHSCYAGVADFFITNDDRMYRILNDVIIIKYSKVIKPEEYIETLI